MAAEVGQAVTDVWKGRDFYTVALSKRLRERSSVLKSQASNTSGTGVTYEGLPKYDRLG